MRVNWALNRFPTTTSIFGRTEPQRQFRFPRLQEIISDTVVYCERDGLPTTTKNII